LQPVGAAIEIFGKCHSLRIAFLFLGGGCPKKDPELGSSGQRSGLSEGK
jgi:hypothetical protein